MKLTINKENYFYPDYLDNLELPENERIKVFWKYPTSAERDLIRSFDDMNFDISLEDINKFTNASKKQRKKMEKEFSLKQSVIKMKPKISLDNAIKFCMTNLVNLEVNNQMIDNSEKLLETKGLGLLVQIIGNKIVNEMDMVSIDSKN